MPPEREDRWVSVRRHFAAAAHETRCWECRVTWKSWLQRLLGIRSGFTPGVGR